MENNFENDWQQAFDDAYVFPPAKVWKNIAEQLPPTEPKRKWWLWALAFLALVSLSGLGGYWFGLTKKTTLSEPKTEVNTNTKSQELSKVPSQIKHDILTQKTQQTQYKVAEILAKNQQEYTAKKQDKLENKIFQNIDNQSINQVENEQISTEKPQENTSINDEIKSVSPANSSTDLSINLEQLNGKLFKFQSSYFTLPEVVYSPTIKKVKAENLKQSWFGISIGLINFNPNMVLNYQSLNAVNNFSANAIDKVSSPKIGFQIEVKAGKMISKNWLFESGFSYLKGNGVLKSNAYLIDRLNSARASLVAGLLAPNTQVQDKTALNVANVLLPTNNTLDQTATWSYLAVPVKLGYQFNTKSKITWLILAGISADFFIQNRIEGVGTVPEKIFTKADNVYKPLNFSGLLALRANYPLSKRTFISAEANYQQALTNGLPISTSISYKPSNIGLNLGLNWKFGK